MRGIVIGTTFVALLATGTASADQPHMQQALQSLRTARRHLEAATPDKGGHREEALRDIDKAIEHVQRGIMRGRSDDS